MSVALALNTFTGRLQVGDSPMRIEQRLAMASFGLALNKSWYLRAWAGGMLDGRLYDSAHSDLKGPPRGRHELTPGWLLSAQATRRLLAQDGWAPFLNATFTIGWSQLGTSPEKGQTGVPEHTGFVATDLRIAATAGWTVGEMWTPYASLRAFAAPFYWHLADKGFADSSSLSGQDVDHYQVAVGSTLRLGGVSVFVDWSMTGETALTAGLGYAWRG